MKRRTNIALFQEKLFDLLIVGGGITGAGIFHEAAKRGYSCLLLEKGDFASGTSSKSAKLIHGGIRYLKYGKIGLIKESLEERNHLLKTYPHLVKPLPFLFPVYDSTFKYRVGMAIYHFLSNDETVPDYRYIEADEIRQIFPFINSEGLRGGFIYFDAVTNDARLCNEVIDEAQMLPGNHALNYCEMISCETQQPVVKIHAHDHIANEKRTFNARYVVNASGVWTDEVLKRATNKETNFSAPSKGVHLVLHKNRFPCDNAIIIPSYANDNRLNYSVPWENDCVIIGTTDTDYMGDLNHVPTDEEDVEYLIRSLQKFAPSLNITRKDIIYTYSGLRPMYHDDVPSYERSRDYRIWWEENHTINILGGKLTSFHSMAETLADELAKKFQAPNGPQVATLKRATNDFSDLPRSFTDSILERFLEKATEIFSIAREHPGYTELLHPDFNATIAETIYFIRNMQCYHLSDLLSRRLSLAYAINGGDAKESVIKKAAALMKTECSWTDEELNNEIAAFHAHLQLHPDHQSDKEQTAPQENNTGKAKTSKC